MWSGQRGCQAYLAQVPRINLGLEQVCGVGANGSSSNAVSWLVVYALAGPAPCSALYDSLEFMEVRNSFVFEQDAWSPGDLLQKIHRDVQEFQRWGSGQSAEIAAAGMGVEHVTLYTDCNLKGDVDRMGGGGVIRDGNGRWISGYATTLGAGDAIKAELLSFHKGLLHTWELGFRHVVCYVDCLELQEVLTSTGDVQNYWHEDVIEMIRVVLARSWTVTINHVTRERNVVADALANLAI
ncbi:uncharacterized protein LOC130730954 [Lotus japonicus]|uniref:uncharacterized protein LOC130730954 n=1 Tax=Lotus japonicus TaxID=34305 RepID=UPI00258EBDD9|nr:uncharacterized protein LOC130730954 [Lotus japonicus]